MTVVTLACHCSSESDTSQEREMGGQHCALAPYCPQAAIVAQVGDFVTDSFFLRMRGIARCIPIIHGGRSRVISYVMFALCNHLFAYIARCRLFHYFLSYFVISSIFEKLHH